MKRVLFTLLAGTMIVIASGCGGSSSTAPATGGEPKADAAAAPADAAKPAEGATK